MSDSDKIAELKNTIKEGVKELQQYANIEMAVGSQLDNTKAEIERLKQKIRQNHEKIAMAEMQRENEEKRAKDELPGEGVQPEPPTYDDEKKEIEELENEIRELNKQKVELSRQLK